MSGTINPAACSTINSMLDDRASESPDATAYIWLSRGEEETGRISYLEMRRQSLSIAGRVQRQGKPMIAALLYPPGLEFITALFGCMYAGVTAVPLPLPRYGRPTDGLQSILKNCMPDIVLTSSRGLTNVAEIIQERLQMDTPVMATDVASQRESAGKELDPDGSRAAYIQYTSGSTSTPRGVVISHANVLDNMAFIDRGFLHDAGSLEVCWLPPFHDMGLVYGILQPIFSGFKSVLMPPAAFIEHPLRWLSAISKYRATHSGGPNFAYDLCVRSKPQTRLDGLELSNWRVAFNGAEPVAADTLDRFNAGFGEYGFKRSSFYPAYGLAESTLKVSGGTAGEGPTFNVFDSDGIVKGNAFNCAGASTKQVRLVSSGRVSNDSDTIVVDPETNEVLPSCKIGEIWTRGASVGAGYLNCPEETERVFHAFTDEGNGPYLRTGDLGFFQERMLFVTGRIKDLIIVNGRNYYPQDIERALDTGKSLVRSGGVLAFSVQEAGASTEDLIIVAETKADSTLIFSRVAADIRLAVISAVGLTPARIIGVDPGSLPRTSSGKLRRSACKAAYINGTLANRVSSELHTSPSEAQDSAESLPTVRSEVDKAQNETLVAIRKIVADALGLGTEDVDIDGDLADLGLESISMLRLAARLQEDFSISLSIPELLRNRTVRKLTDYVSSLSALPRVVAEPARREGVDQHQQVGFTQQSLLYQHQLAERADALNITRALEIEGELQEEILQEALVGITRRHRVLRSAFPQFPSEEAAQILPLKEEWCSLRRVNTEPTQVAHAIRTVANQAFNLEQGPLFRVHLISAYGMNPVLVFVFHHSICDLWSLMLLFDELWSDYQRLATGMGVPAATESGRDFYDYVQDHRAFLASPAGAELRRHWINAARPELPPLTLTDKAFLRQRGSHEVDYKQFVVNEDAIRIAGDCARQLKISMAELYFGLFQIAMSYYSGLSAFRVGMSTHGRSTPADAKLIGCIVNILPISARVESGWTVQQTLRNVSEAARTAREYGDYPYYLNLQLIAEGEHVKPAPHIIFHHYKTVMSDLDSKFMHIALGHSDHRIEAHGVKLVTKGLYNEAGQHQVTFSTAQIRDKLFGTVEWSNELLTSQTVELLIEQYCSILKQLPAHLDHTVGELLYAADQPLQRHIDAINSTRVNTRAELLHGAFERQAAETPDALAVIGEGEPLSYKELDTAAEELAQTLCERGAGPDVIVGLCLHRSELAIIGMLAVLKAGAAYMPIDPEYPDDRIARIVAKSGCRMVVTVPALERRVRDAVCDVICLQEQRPIRQGRHQRQRIVDTSEQSLAYVMFTSGSTGEPKGVMIDHRAICNRLRWMQSQYVMQGKDRVLQKTPYTFDVSVWEVFWPLSVGATIVLAKHDGHRDPIYLADLIDKAQVTIAHFVPSMLREFLEANSIQPLTSLKRVISSGEALPWRVARECLQSRNIQLDNLYGPTEAAIDVTCSHVVLPLPHEEVVPIGRPIDNVEVYVLDEALYPVPIGRIGELFLGGIALARGYIGSPGLTAERFVPDPYGAPGGRLYKTGDLVRLDAPGDLHFIGRKDRQVKLRGQRVELGEIEAWIRSHSEVRDVTAQVLNPATPAETLVAYIVTGGNEDRVVQEIQGILKAELPPYMIPARFIPMTQFPLTTSGKLDSKMLPSPDAVRTLVNQDRAPGGGEETEVETTLLDIWREVLQIKEIGIHDSFFSLGGHSLAATQVISRIRKQMSIQLPLSVIFSDDATIAKLAEEIAARAPVAAGN